MSAELTDSRDDAPLDPSSGPVRSLRRFIRPLPSPTSTGVDDVGRYSVVATVGISALVVALTFFRLIEGYVEVEAVDAWALLAIASIVAACALRHRSREAFLAVSFLANLAYTFDLPPSYPGLGLIASLPFAAYGVAAHRATARAVGMASVVAAGLIGTAMIVRGVTLLNVFPLTVLSLLTCGIAFGLLAKTRRRLLASVRKAALEAAETREALAEARVSEERLRNARNLHDVIGHRVAVINLQAEAAAQSSAPHDVAAPALRTISGSAREILDEIGVLLSGTPDEVPPSRRRSADIPQLVAELAAGGLSIRCTLLPLPLPEPIADRLDTTLYLLAEEALVNACKYASREAPVELSIAPHEGGVALRVFNVPGCGSAAHPLSAASSGMGLAGIRERAAALGGQLTVDSSATRFELQVVLPVRP